MNTQDVLEKFEKMLITADLEYEQIDEETFTIYHASELDNTKRVLLIEGFNWGLSNHKVRQIYKNEGNEKTTVRVIRR